MRTKAHICIIDDDDAIRDALRLLLFSAGLESTAYESADAFLADGQEQTIDCMLLDIRMPGTDGLELFRQLKAGHLLYPVIFITGHGEIPLAVSAIKQGAYDFLTKPFKEGEMLKKIFSAIDHHQERLEEHKELMELRQRAESCTPREHDVMLLLADGLANKGIAESLGISPRTVEIHRSQVMNKMQADSLAALVRMVALLETT
jgi:FixJ family two-component response regulator